MPKWRSTASVEIKGSVRSAFASVANSSSSGSTSSASNDCGQGSMRRSATLAFAGLFAAVLVTSKNAGLRAKGIGYLLQLGVRSIDLKIEPVLEGPLAIRTR